MINKNDQPNWDEASLLKTKSSHLSEWLGRPTATAERQENTPRLTRGQSFNAEIQLT